MTDRNNHVADPFKSILNNIPGWEPMKIPCRITDGQAYPVEWDSEITDEDRENAKFEAEERVQTGDYWHDRELDRDEADQLSRAMQCIDSACTGDKIAIGACLDALAKIQKHAILNETESILDGD